MIMSRD